MRNNACSTQVHKPAKGLGRVFPRATGWISPPKGLSPFVKWTSYCSSLYRFEGRKAERKA